MLYWGLLLCSVTALVLGDQEIHLKSGDNWSSAIQSQGYPEPPASRDAINEKWVLTTEPGSTIKVFCLDFRFVYDPKEPCKHGSMTFDDGNNKITKCGVEDGVIVKSTGSKMTVELKTLQDGGGIFDCRAKGVGDASKNSQSLEMSSGEEEKEISMTGDGKEKSESWVIKSNSGEPVYVKCDMELEDKLHTGECSKDVITVNNGQQTEEYCGYKAFYVESKTGQITLTAELFDGSEGRFECRAGVGENKPPTKRIFDFWDDSSEHGVAPGEKDTTCECGMANRDYGRIINGTETLEGEYPFMVSLRAPNGGHFCGASIITPRHILTAAHCVSAHETKHKPVPSSVFPIVGAHYRWQTSSHGEQQRLTVKEIHVHDTWFDKKFSMVGDIAILVLDKPLTYSQYVSPVCMSSKPLPIVNQDIRLIGWGRTEAGTGSPVLLQADVLVLDTNQCNRDERETCFKYEVSASCSGDSGGPYVYLDPETNRYTQAAVVSYVYKQCLGSYFIGTNVVHYYDWINGVIKATSNEKLCMKND